MHFLPLPRRQTCKQSRPSIPSSGGQTFADREDGRKCIGSFSFLSLAGGGGIPSSRQGETGRGYEVYYYGGGGGRNNASLRHLHYRFQRKIPRRGKENEKCFFLHLRKQHKSAFFLPLCLLFQGQTNENPFLTFLFGNPLAFSLILIETSKALFYTIFVWFGKSQVLLLLSLWGSRGN